MRFKNRQSVLCLYFFIQVACAYHKNDYFKNQQRTNTKKHLSTNAISSESASDSFRANTGLTNVKVRHKHFQNVNSRIDNEFYSEFSANSDGYADSVFSSGRGTTFKTFRHQGREFFPSSRRRFSKTTTTTTTTPEPDDDSLDNYGDLIDSEADLEEFQDYEDTDLPNKLFADKNKQRNTESLEDNDSHDLFNMSGEDDLDINNEDYDNVQAEEPTERPTAAPIPLSLMGRYKWENFGTRKAVEESRRKHTNLRTSSEELKAAAALEHFLRVKLTASCQKPIPKVIPVQNEHPNTSVIYKPHCTILNRCAEDTGCCKQEEGICQYKEREEVSLYFYVHEIGSNIGRVEMLKFYNHTECACRERRVENGTEQQKQNTSSRSSASSVVVRSSDLLPNDSGTSFRNDAPENLQIKCKCPKEYTPRIRYFTKCSCDCEQTNEDCLRMKKGKEYFSLVDRLCILRNECGLVHCEYGNFKRDSGRCPRRED